MATEDDLLIEIGLTEKQYLASMARLEAQTVKSAKRIEDRFNRSVGAGASRSFRQADQAARGFAGGGLRNTMMQLSQVAQQGAATGDYVRALSIQLPDLALGFGAAGIAAGALAGVLLPLGLDMLDFGDQSEELEGKLKALDQAMNNLRSADGALRSPDLLDTYGRMTEQAQKLLEIEREIAAFRAQQAFNEVTRGFANEIGVGDAFGLSPETIEAPLERMRALQEEREQINSNVSQMSDEELAAADRRVDAINAEIDAIFDLRDGLRKVANELGLNEEAAQHVARAFAEISAMDDAEARAKATAEMVGFIDEASNGLAEASDEGKELYDNLRTAVLRSLELAGMDITSPITSAANEAARLAGNLALARAERVAAINAEVTGGNADFFDPRNEAGVRGVKFEDRPVPEQNRPGYKPKTSGRKGGGKSGGGATREDKELNRLLAERERILRDLETASDRYAKSKADLDKLLAMGKLTAEQYAGALAKIEDQYVEAEFGKVLNGIDDISNALAESVVEWESFGDAVRDVFKSILKEAIASNIRGILTGGLPGASGGGGGVMGFFGALFGGRRARGGDVQAGKIYQVGEEGPETFVPSVDGKIVPAGGGMRGGGGVVQIEIVGGAQFDARVRQVAGPLAVEVTGAGMKQLRDNFGDTLGDFRARGV